jgi:SSS family solute:Na+ symporter
MRTLVELSTLDIIIFVAYLVILGLVAAWASFGNKKKEGNIFLANKSLGWFAIGLTMWGTNVGPSMLIANASSGFEGGIAAGNFSWYAFPFIMLLAFVFAPRYLGAKVTTLPEYMGKRFGEQTRNYIAWYSILTILISWLGLTLFSGGVFMAQLLAIPLWACIAILVAVSALFTMAGGLKAIAYTNVYQMLLLIGVSVLLVVMGINKVGGLGSVVRDTPVEFWNLFRPLDDKDFPWLAILVGYPVMGVWFWCTDQSMVQSVLGAKNLKEGQKGANFCAWLKLLDIPLFILPGILCFLLLPGLANSTDSYLQLVNAVFPSGLMGLVIVVMVAALISTIGSALNSLSTVFTMDIYIKKFRPDAGDSNIRTIGRWVVLIGALISVFLAIGITYIQGLSFFNIFQSVLGFLAPPMAASFLFAAFWKKTSTQAVNLVLTVGTAFSIGTGILYYTGLIFSGMHYLYLSFFIFVVLALFIFIWSMATSKPSLQTMEYVPIKVSKGVKLAWGILVLCMIGVYLFFNGFVEQLPAALPDLLGTAQLEQPNGIEVAHHQNIRRTNPESLFHIGEVSEMQDPGSAVYHGLGALPAVTAIMQNNIELIVLQSFYYLTNIIARKCLTVFVGQQSRRRFGHKDPGGSTGFKGITITDQKTGAFIEQEMNRIGIHVNFHHDFGKTEQPASQRKGPYTSRQNNLVLDVFDGQPVGQ